MARPIRIEFAGALYHVTSRGDRRAPIYEDDADRACFLKVLGLVAGDFNWVCHAWCLMGNHYHLVVETPDGNLSKGIRQLNGVYTQKPAIAGIDGWGTCSRGGTKPFLWIGTATCWN